MASIYKMFERVRIVLMALCLSFLWGALIAPQSANAQNTIFTVENITVDVKAENALKAREKAFEEAQVKGFEELYARMVADSETAASTPPPVSTISLLIQDYEVSNEQLSSNRYKGTYKFRFKERDVKKYFSKQGQSFTDVASKPILVLPFLETSGGAILWSPQNIWMKAWLSTPNLSSGVVPVILPRGDLSDISDIDDSEALTYQKRNLDALVQRYNASEAVVAIARPEGTALNIQLYRTDRARPEYVHQIMERAIAGQTQDQIYLSAVQSVRQALRQDWKQKTVVSNMEEKGTVKIRARFSSLQEWSNLQRNLNSVSGISETSLQALSPREAYINVSYIGSFERLKIALAQRDLTLSTPQVQNTSANGRLNADYSSGLLGAYTKSGSTPDAIYDLNYKRSSYAPAAAQPFYTPQAAPGTQQGGYSSRF